MASSSVTNRFSAAGHCCPRTASMLRSYLRTTGSSVYPTLTQLPPHTPPNATLFSLAGSPPPAHTAPAPALPEYQLPPCHPPVVVIARGRRLCSCSGQFKRRATVTVVTPEKSTQTRSSPAGRIIRRKRADHLVAGRSGHDHHPIRSTPAHPWSAPCGRHIDRTSPGVLHLDAGLGRCSQVMPSVVCRRKRRRNAGAFESSCTA